ncbi:hypothetical protein [Criblamydia sequanensis]|uniref:Uncharacterized protein n=1 Tax=Candidatus Criblamydia sequanensis CRIB-18 TaxID=1437425 RepID=A0A090CZI6_9BACT|nr:hypothetical protein [Criblamydia sequanensis]CDR34331.1 hypothetical protein CSEC_1517 [Criblamydia sequanensis CRIB-18]
MDFRTHFSDGVVKAWTPDTPISFSGDLSESSKSDWVAPSKLEYPEPSFSDPYERVEVTSRELEETSASIESFIRSSKPAQILRKSVKEVSIGQGDQPSSSIGEKEEIAAPVFNSRKRKGSFQVRKKTTDSNSSESNGEAELDIRLRAKELKQAKKARVSSRPKQDSPLRSSQDSPVRSRFDGEEEEEYAGPVKPAVRASGPPIGPSRPLSLVSAPPPQATQTGVTLRGEEISNILFSQKRISESLSDGTPIFTPYQPERDYSLEKLMNRKGVLSEKVKKEKEAVSLQEHLRTRGWDSKKPNLKTVKMVASDDPKDGLTSFDNRRLTLAKVIVDNYSHSLEIKADIHPAAKPATPQLWSQVQSSARNTPILPGIGIDTYGHALLGRITNNGQLPPVVGYSDMPIVSTSMGPRKIRVIHGQVSFTRS